MECALVYFVGTAGSGKTTLTSAFHTWLAGQNIDAVVVNLDPGAEDLPYSPEVDVRDWFRLADVMEEYGLGPNGAQVACADLLALKAGELREELDRFRADYILVDTPGQLELFAFRQASSAILGTLDSGASAIAYLVDPLVARTASGLVSQLLLSAATQFRFGRPLLNLLARADLIGGEEADEIVARAADPYRLNNALMDEAAGKPGGGDGKPFLYSQLSAGLFRALEEMGAFRALTPVSARDSAGLEEIYNTVQQTFMGGEDLGR